VPLLGPPVSRLALFVPVLVLVLVLVPAFAFAFVFAFTALFVLEVAATAPYAPNLDL
jgi:hypothetical protein